MHNPERYTAQRLHILETCSPAESHCRSHFLGIGADEIECAVAAETHTEHIDACRVHGIVCLHPFQQVVQFTWVPCSAGILRCHHVGRDNLPFLQCIKCTIAAHPFEVVAAKAGPVQEDDDGQRMAAFLVFLGRVEPEIVAAVDDVTLGLDIAFGLCRDTRRGEHPHEKKQGK